jgi:hypothetical protein
VEDGLFDNESLLKMFNYYAFEEFGGDTAVPDTVWVHHQYGPPFAYTETWGLATLDTGGTEQEPFPL